VDISQEQAIKKLRELVAEIESLKTSAAFSEAHTRWLSNALYLIERVFSRRSRIYLTLARLPWRKTGEHLLESPVYDVEEVNQELRKISHEAYLEDLDTAKGLLEAGIDVINDYGMDGAYEEKDTSKDVGEAITLIGLAENKLRKTMRTEPQEEREVQEKFENVLTSVDFKYLRDQETISYSSKSYKPDFTFPGIDTALEIKLCNRTGREKVIIDEINADILAYKTKYPNIIFLVYDVGHIRDVDRFKEGIESQDGVIVVVVKH